jgi:hypothetical protein
MSYGSEKDFSSGAQAKGRKDVTFEFYDIFNHPDLNGALTNALSSLNLGGVSISDRKWEYNGDIYRIHNFIKPVSDSVDCQGSFVRLRKKNPSWKVTREDADNERDVELMPGEKLMETMYFKYFDSTRTLVVQVNRDAGTAVRLLEYIANRAGMPNLTFSVRIVKDSFDKVKRFTKISRMELSLVTGLPVPDQDPENSVHRVTDLSQIYGGCEIEIIIKNRSIHNGTRPLVNDNIIETAEYIQNKFGWRTKKARFKGKSDIDTKEKTIDLIDGKMKETIPISENALPTEYYRAIDTAYANRHKELLAAVKDRMAVNEV